MINQHYLMTKRKFWFDNKCCTEFGIIATGLHTFNAPERDVQKVRVPGRNGDLVIDNGHFKNVSVSYPISIYKDFSEKAMGAKSWLLSSGGYKKLEDAYNPGFFRMAMFTGPIDFDVKLLGRIGETTLNFDCKPQLYDMDGTYPQSFDKPSILFNQYEFPALPIVNVYGSGSGTLTIGEKTIQIKNMTDTLTIDCEMQNAYRRNSGGLENLNRYIYAPEFPELRHGESVVSWTGGIERVEIIPRWWTI